MKEFAKGFRLVLKDAGADRSKAKPSCVSFSFMHNIVVLLYVCSGVLEHLQLEEYPKHCRYGDPSNAYRAIAMNQAMHDYGGISYRMNVSIHIYISLSIYSAID